MLQNLQEGSSPNDSELEGSNGFDLSWTDIACINKGSVQAIATLLQHLLASFATNFQKDNIAARVCGYINQTAEVNYFKFFLN